MEKLLTGLIMGKFCLITQLHSLHNLCNCGIFYFTKYIRTSDTQYNTAYTHKIRALFSLAYLHVHLQNICMRNTTRAERYISLLKCGPGVDLSDHVLNICKRKQTFSETDVAGGGSLELSSIGISVS